MYPVSADYKNAIKKEVRDVRITGTITLKDDTVITITDEDVVQGSLYITEQCVSGEDIEVGNVYAAEMGLSLSTPLDNPYSLDGARILLHFGLKLDVNLWETVPLGYYYVTDIARKAGNVDITALDGMMLFDVPVGDPGLSSPKDLIAYACSIAGVTLANVAEVANLANATSSFELSDKSKVKTCRDLLMWTCQLMGAFARMDRQGQLEIVPIAARQAVKAINKKERFSSDVSDFAVKITKISMQVGEAEYSRGDDGMTMVLEENPLMVGLSDEQVNSVLDSLLTQLTQAVYVPFRADYIGDPALQPGDYVIIRDAGILDSEIETYFLADTMPFDIRTDVIASMITHSTWRYRGKHNIKAAGKIGLVRGVQNQQMKAASSMAAMARATQDLALSINQSTQLIKDAMGGHVLIRQAPDETNEILIMDHPDPELATKIWRWNMGGLGYSDNVTGADNPAREYEIAMTMDGAINANFIKTGVLDAQFVKVGAGTTFDAGYNPSAKNSNYMQDTDPVTTWSEFNSHIEDTWYSQAEQKTRIFKNNESYFFNLGVGGGSVINGYAGSSLSTLDRPVPISHFGIKGATAGIGSLYLWKLDSNYKFSELIASGTKVYEDGGANYHCELTLEANTNYAIIASVMGGKISIVEGSSVIRNDWVTGVLNKNYSEMSAPVAGTELASTSEHEIRLGIYDWIEVKDANLKDFIEGIYASDLFDIGARIDSKTDTYYQTDMPHPEYTNVVDNQTYNNYVGDMWYNNNPSSKQTYRYTKITNGSNYDYKWLEEEIPKAIFDTIDGKRTVFTSTTTFPHPTTPYYVGDLWLTSVDNGMGDLKKCIQERLTGDYVQTDWVLATKYTDDTAVTEHNNNSSPHGLPDYATMGSEGFKVYDGEDNLRTHNGQYATNKYGFKALHTDGSFTTLDADGLLRHIADQHKNYLFMVHGGEESTYNEVYLILKRWATWDGPVESGGYYYYQPYCNYAYSCCPYFPPGDPNYSRSWDIRFGTGNGVSDNGMDYIQESDVFEWITDTWVYLPDEWKNIDYNVILSVKEYELPASFIINMDDNRTTTMTTSGSPKFVLKVMEKITGTTPQFRVRAYYQIKNKWKTEHKIANYFNNGSGNFVETDQIFYARGITFSYIVIA